MQISFNWQVILKVVHEQRHCSCETEVFHGFGSVGQAAVKATFLASAIRKCGGNEEKGNLLYTAYGSSGQVTQCYPVMTHCSKMEADFCELYSGVCLIDNSEGVMQQRQIQKGGSHYGEKQLFKR